MTCARMTSAGLGCICLDIAVRRGRGCPTAANYAERCTRRAYRMRELTRVNS